MIVRFAHVHCLSCSLAGQPEVTGPVRRGLSAFAAGSLESVILIYPLDEFSAVKRAKTPPARVTLRARQARSRALAAKPMRDSRILTLRVDSGTDACPCGEEVAAEHPDRGRVTAR